MECSHCGSDKTVKAGLNPSGSQRSWQVVTARTTETMQPVIDEAPPAFQYCTDGFSVYETLNYHRGLHLVAEGKSQTYSVEGGNADLRHYLARLAK